MSNERHIDEVLARYEARNAAKKVEEEKRVEEEVDNDPLKDVLEFEGCPVGMIKSDGIPYLACLVSGEEVMYPLVYQERIVPADVPEMGARLGVQIQAEFNTIPLMDSVQMAISYVYYLKSSEPGDRALFDQYVKVLKDIRMDKSGLVSPTDDQLMQLTNE